MDFGVLFKKKEIQNWPRNDRLIMVLNQSSFFALFFIFHFFLSQFLKYAHKSIPCDSWSPDVVSEVPRSIKKTTRKGPQEAVFAILGNRHCMFSGICKMEREKLKKNGKTKKSSLNLKL